MVKFYVNKIQNGDLTLDEVPAYWREKVRLELEKDTQ